MSAAMTITSEADEHKEGKMTLIVLSSGMIAAVGGALFGYDIGVSGGVTSMGPFLEKFFPEVYTKMKQDKSISNYCKFDSQLLTLFSSSLYISGLIASFFASPITKAFGRKPSILSGGAAFVIGSVLGGAAVNLYMLVLGRLLLGIGVAFVNQSVPLYLSEIAPSRHRGGFNTTFHFSVSVGILCANLINFGTEKLKGGWGWRISLAAAAIPALFLSLGSLFLPETPNSLIQRRNNNVKAKKMLQRIRGIEDVDAEFDDLLKANEKSKTIKHPFKKIFARKYRPQLVMAIAIPFFQQVTGINVIGIYAAVLFRSMGLGESASLFSTCVIGILGMGSNIVSVFIVDRVGRRVMLIGGGIQMLVSQIVIGTILANQLGDQGGISKDYALVVLVFICLYEAGFNLSWGPLEFLIPSEIFPLEIRSAGQSVTVAVNFLFLFLTSQTLLALLCHFKFGTFFFFGGWIMVMTVFIFFFLPETKNVPIEQMDRVWREHWFWKQFTGQEVELGNKEEE